LSGDPLKITKITDPFGRSANFGYTNGQLTSISADHITISRPLTNAAPAGL